MDKTSEQHLLLLNEVKKMKKTIVSWRQDRGHWRTNFRINGKRIYKKIPLLEKNQKAEAVEFATQLYMRYIRGEMFDECKITFKEATQSYFEHNSVSEKSKKNKLYRLQTIFKFIGDTRLDKITYLDYDNIRHHLKKVRGIKNQSVNRYFQDIQVILNLAKKRRLIKDFPEIVMLKNEPPRMVRDLSQEELDIIYAHLPTYLKDPFEFAWRTGLRRANLIGLQRKHLERLEDGNYKVSFPPEEMKRREPFEFITTRQETEILNRNIDIKYKFIFRRDRQVNGATLDGGLGDIKKAIASTREKCGFYWTWHWLRHTTATRYASQFTEQQMNKLMAWSPKSRMAGHYSHIKIEDQLRVMRQEDSDNIDNPLTTKNENKKKPK